MTLPALIDYATPRHTPTNRVNWTLDPSRAAVLVHDLQRYFFRAFAPGCPALERALAATAEILAAARAAGVPVFYTAQTGDQSTDERSGCATTSPPCGASPSPTRPRPRPGCARSSRGRWTWARATSSAPSC